MADNIERLAVLIEANTKSYENAMKRLQQQTDQALRGVNDNFTRARKPAADLEGQITRTGHAAGGMSTQASSLFHATRSMAEGFAAGIPPSQILAQQINHLSYAATGPGGLAGAFKELAGKAAGLFGPGGLMAVGIIGGFAAAGLAAYEFYKLVIDQEPSAEKVLEEHKRVVEAVKKAYEDAKHAAGQFTDEVRSALLLEAKQNLADLQKQLKDTSETFIRGLDSHSAMMPMDTFLSGDTIAAMMAAQDKYGAFTKVLDQFNASVKDGAPNVSALQEGIAQLGLNDPGLQKTAVDLLKIARAVSDAYKSMKEGQSAVNMLEGKGTNTDRKQLGMSAAPATNAYKSLVQATKDQIDEFKFEAQTAGQAGFQVDGLKKNHELLRAALKSGLPDTQRTRDAIKALSDQYAAAKGNAAAMKLQADLLFERQQLGRTPEEQQVASQLRAAGIDAASATGMQTAAQIRLNQTLTETRDIAKGALSTFVSDLQQGKSGAEALSDALAGIENKLLDMAENKLIASLFGGALGGGFGGGGLLGGLFGGFFADGGDFAAGKPIVVGEKGPEIIYPRSGGTVVPNGQTTTRGGVTMVDQSVNTYNASISGADRAWIAAVIDQKVAASEARQRAFMVNANRRLAH